MFVDPKHFRRIAPNGRRKDGTLRQQGVGKGVGGGNPNVHQPTAVSRKQIHAMAGYGLNEKKIAKVMGIAHMTLRKHYAEELENGREVADSQVLESLFQNCKNGNVTAQIFWLCNRMPEQWQTVTKIEHAGEVKHDHTHDHAHRIADLDHLDPAQLAGLYRQTARAPRTLQ